MSQILIVEDDHRVVTFISSILLADGHTCLAAASAAEAQAAFNSNHDIGLVLLDQNLEQSNSGVEFLTWLRSTPRGRKVPVIICSGDSRPTVLTAFLQQQIAGFIKKPFKADRLLLDVQRVLMSPDGVRW